MSYLFRFWQFLKYQKKAKSKYYLHSPFVYQFYLRVLEGGENEILQRISVLRDQLKHSQAAIVVNDFGTGQSSSRRVAELESRVAVKEKYGKLLYHLVQHFQPKNIVEIGTSIGISAAYMALANSGTKIISLEGSESLIDLAKQNHASLGIVNTSFIGGSFDTTIDNSLQKLSSVDLILFDGNHTKQATLNYFEKCLRFAHEHSVFVFDDIYWSQGMKEAWEEIKQNKQITLTLDVYQFGICFFRKEKLAKENFVLRY